MTIEEREHILTQLEASGLLGRGGGWFPAHRKWCAVLAEDGVPVVVANGGESEPGSIKDRFLIRTRPADVLAGLKVAMDVVGADQGYVYLKGSFAEEETLLHRALKDMGGDPRITIHRGDDTYVGGEETAVLESIEGRVAWPRPKPPRPSSVGLFGRPTLVQNIDTLARVPEAIRSGAAYATQPSMAITIWGDVRNPGAYEIQGGRTLRSVVEQEGGGPTSDVALVFPNSAQAMPFTPDQLDIALDPGTFAGAGSPLGTASILVLNSAASHLSILDSVARFFEREACGQCPPCVLGTTNLRELVTGAKPSTHRLIPQAALKETAWFMSIHGYCSHARQGASAVTGLFARWQDEVIERLRGSDEGGGAESRDPFAPNSRERQALEAFLTRL
ncbi:MAG: NADH-ubiquinone oxidoreductase-F iron-sulfur binding region domain-containing protein [Vicinamibacteria bacterium]